MAASHERFTIDSNFFAAYIPNALTPAQCDALILEGNHAPKKDPWPWCPVDVRRFELGSPALQPLQDVADLVAREVWPNYEFRKEDFIANFNSYEPNDECERHADSGPGAVSWKVICVALLSDESTYRGARLVLDPPMFGPRPGVSVPRARGGVVLFQPGLPHYVTQLFLGPRHVVNAGFWGPPWR